MHLEGYSWQDGYPNPNVIDSDIKQGYGYVLEDGQQLIGYVAILMNDEPAYASLSGSWLSEGDFLVIHRVAVSDFRGNPRKAYEKLVD
ncbi:hypothetical protein [Pedobacter sp. GR22-6]|uniref:hypothetical protein n=1 Tax=Pedobacter sp. GR22-6 TaxID=3127957 RepID=UPI00307F5D3B